MPLVQLSASFQSLSPAIHKQIGPFWCCFPGGWFCVSSRTLWLFPTNSTVSLGVYPAASILTGVFNQRFEALFPQAGALGCLVCFAPPLFLLVCLCWNMGRWGLLAVALPTPFIPQSTTSPELPGVLSVLAAVSAPLTGLDGCFFFMSLVVGLPCSSILCQFWCFFCF